MKEHIKEFTKKPYIRVLIIGLIIAIAIPLASTVARFVIDKIKDYYLESKNFFFNSNRLKEDNPLYQINNWSGVGNFVIEISLDSYKNTLLASDYDIPYEVEYTCNTDVLCSSAQNEGIIYSSTNTDVFTLIISPNKVFNDGESTTIHIEATSTEPYVKTISADFQIVVGKRGITYFIDDEASRPYMLVTITNALNYYTVKEAFDTYQIGDEIDSSVYTGLTAVNKAKCVSALITLEFDPNDVVLDITSSIFNESTYEEETINGIPYVNEVTFPLLAMSSTEVRFYKIDVTEDYTYPFENTDSIVDFSVE